MCSHIGIWLSYLPRERGDGGCWILIVMHGPTHLMIDDYCQVAISNIESVGLSLI